MSDSFEPNLVEGMEELYFGADQVSIPESDDSAGRAQYYVESYVYEYEPEEPLELTRLCNSWWIISQSGTAHIPAVPETAQNARWRTLCGWHYGTAPYQKTWNRPTDHLCRKCFRDLDDDDHGTSSEDELS